MKTATKAAPKTNVIGIGSNLAGGFVRGHYLHAMRAQALVSAPIAIGLLADRKWHSSYTMVKDAQRWDDGLANTLAMAKAGSPVAKEILALEVKGEKGWFIPARLEALAVHYSRHEAKIFAPGGAEHIERGWIWTSTQYGVDADYAWAQHSADGSQFAWRKSVEFRVLAVRRVEI